MEGQPSFFRGARNTKVGRYAQFNRAKNVSTTYNVTYRRREKQSVVPIKHNSKEIDPEDIIYQKQTSSEVLELYIERTLLPAMAAPRLRKIKVRKEVHTAEIAQLNGRLFSVYTFEPEDREDKEALKTVWKRVYEGSSQKSLLFPQRFGVGRSEIPMLIVHDELVNGHSFGRKYKRSPIIISYLWYTLSTSCHAARNSGNLAKLLIPVLGDWHHWSINVRTGSWYYDLPSISVRGESIKKDTPRNPLIVNYQRNPLPQHPRSELDPQQILSVFEKQFGDYLRSIALEGETRHFDKLTDFAPHRLLTFGTVMDRTAGIVGHFPSTPAPKWSCCPFRSDVDARYSKSVPSRVDLSITKLGGPSRAELHFRLRLRSEDRYRLRAAFLARSLDFYHNNPDDLVFIDQVRFSLIGTFHRNPSTHSPPAYLFVPPIHVEILHGMPCIKYPFPELLFYWSLDRKGTHRILETDWEKYRIPRLKVETWIGSMWQQFNYCCVEDCLQLKGYAPTDGRRYAQDHNYPELLEGDPHEIRLVECEESETRSDGEAESIWETSSDEETQSNLKTESDESSAGAEPSIVAPVHMHKIQGRNLACVQPALLPSPYRSQTPDQSETDTDGGYSDTSGDSSDSDASFLKDYDTSSSKVDDLCARFANLALD